MRLSLWPQSQNNTTPMGWFLDATSMRIPLPRRGGIVYFPHRSNSVKLNSKKLVKSLFIDLFSKNPDMMTSLKKVIEGFIKPGYMMNKARRKSGIRLRAANRRIINSIARH